MRSDRSGATPNPPTIAKLRAMGVAGAYVTCRGCQRSKPVAFDLLKLPPETFFPDIVKLRRFACRDCGSRIAVLTPDWRGMRTPGAGGM